MHETSEDWGVILKVQGHSARNVHVHDMNRSKETKINVNKKGFNVNKEMLYTKCETCACTRHTQEYRVSVSIKDLNVITEML